MRACIGKIPRATATTPAEPRTWTPPTAATREGKIISITYPTTTNNAFLNYPQSPLNGSPDGLGTYPGASYNYSYDSMYRLSGMTSGSTTVVNGVSYNAANQLLGMTFNGTPETRTYNSLNQLTNITAGSTENLTYAYPTGANNGKIGSVYNAASGEAVSYTYDSLNRLLTATASGTGNWGEQYGFDGFGNLLSKTVTAGSGPSMSVTVNPANNQAGGLSYDANGNVTEMYNGTQEIITSYDAENRMVGASHINGGPLNLAYGYDAQNRRIFSWAGATDYSGQGNPDIYQVTLYSPTGQRLGSYQIDVVGIGGPGTALYGIVSTLMTSDQYFGGRRLAMLDQLGSVVQNNGSQVQSTSRGARPKARSIRRTPGISRRIGRIRPPGWITRIIATTRMGLDGS